MQGLISRALLDRWQDVGDCEWQWCPDGGHLAPLAMSRGCLPELVGVLFFALLWALVAL